MATPTTKGSSRLKASIAAPISFRKQRLILAASSDDNGGHRRVFEKPFRGVLIITPIAHLSVTAGFRQAAVSISTFIVAGPRRSVSIVIDGYWRAMEQLEKDVSDCSTALQC